MHITLSPRRSFLPCALLCLLWAAPALAQSPGSAAPALSTEEPQLPAAGALAGLPPRHLGAAPQADGGHAATTGEERIGGKPRKAKKTPGTRTAAAVKQKDALPEQIAPTVGAPEPLAGEPLHSLAASAEKAAPVKREEVPASARLNAKGVAYRGLFLHGNENPQLLLVEPGEGVSVYLGSTRMAQLKGLDLASDASLKALGVKEAILPVELIQDGTTQLLVWRKVPAADGSVHIHATVLKPIGRFFGHVLDRHVATRKGDKVTVHARLGVLQDNTQPDLLWTPLDAKGTPTSTQRVLRWNVWSGTFHAWEPVPTAPKLHTPKQPKPQS